MSESKDPERRFRDALGYTFQNRHRLLEAVTHRSFINELAQENSGPRVDNERLEYLGDAVLDLIVATELVARFPHAKEGELSTMRATMVREAALAELARKIELGPMLRVGRGEELSGGRERPSLLADAFEAIVAAIYLEAGLEGTTKVVLPLIDFTLGEQLAAIDSKTTLQNRIQAERKATPRYRVLLIDGPEHDRRFQVEVTVEEDVIGTGEGRSKKQAEQAAAAAALQALEPDSEPS